MRSCCVLDSDTSMCATGWQDHLKTCKQQMQEFKKCVEEAAQAVKDLQPQLDQAKEAKKAAKKELSLATVCLSLPSDQKCMNSFIS